MKKVYIVWTNTDLTEGKGEEYPLAICESIITARRLGKGSYAMGSDCRITHEELIRHNNRYYGPVRIMRSTPEEDRAQKQYDLKQEAIEKAKLAGLTEEDIKLLCDVN